MSVLGVEDGLAGSRAGVIGCGVLAGVIVLLWCSAVALMAVGMPIPAVYVGLLLIPLAVLLAARIERL